MIKPRNQRNMQSGISSNLGGLIGSG
jgi:hypothetical protein